ncbi:aminoglycoside 3 -phosphotransferase choline kinase protein [Fusarium sporotrichioides]|uniref:Aminoglycoside 3-phosphotransferase choline kinase protein n=1 Tax=Fusarium sporotrichioides TaxID=5514 RepID=A0A395RLA9_FUSSP|nr:aminoglycoside 3 -phosphotransferase choline kinase protein [Fusarium sporotrichioides]
MSPPGSGESRSLAIDVEAMNPARARMLAGVAPEDTRNRTPSPEVKTEEGYKLGPLRSGANTSALGDRSQRISRSSQQPEGSRVASTTRPNASLPRLPENIDPNTSNLPKRPFSAVVKQEINDREKKPKLSTNLYYTDVQTLGPAPRSDANTRYLTSLLRNRTLFLTLQRIAKKNKDDVKPKTYEFRISQAGLVQHEKLSLIAHTRALPLFSQDPATSSSDGNLSQTIVGELLEDAWPRLSKHEKYQYARQLRNILQKLRSHEKAPPGGAFGSIKSGPYGLILDKHPGHTYFAVRVDPDQQQFMALLMSTLYSTVPTHVSKALVKQFRTDYPSVLTHGNLCPRNIIVSNNTIAWILGWDCAGHYPVWWEYARFFEARTTEENSDWYEYAEQIFADEYPVELAAYQGIARCQQP